MKKYIYSKVYLPVVAYLKQGVSPRKLAMSVAFGCALGIVPFLGVTTLLCALTSFFFRLNMGVIQIVNYAVYPLQILFFIPFVKAGTFLFASNPLPFSVEQITNMFNEGVVNMVLKLGYFNILGVAVWMLIAPVIMLTVYYVGYWLFSKSSKVEQ